ncbi:MAG: hypothetical protein E6K75_01780, partial [Candidatus Eisenbacteria bacterium]
ASLWVDKLVAWCLVGGETARLHAGASTLAWFSSIPCLAWIFVEVETAFHRRFQGFYRALEGGASLAELRRGARALVDEAARLVRGALSVEAGVVVFLELAAAPCAHWLRLSADAILPYRFLLAGAGAQAVGLLGLILLYYFDLRREACLAASSLFVAVTALTVAASASRLPPSVGTALGCSIGAVLIWRFVFRGIRTVLENTLLGQPFEVGRRGKAGSERRREPHRRDTMKSVAGHQ